MSAPQAIEVDAEGQEVGWRENGAMVRTRVPGAFAARYDPVSDRLLVLTGNGPGAVAILSRTGEELARIEAPAGYVISHFADTAGATIVCQGDAPDGAWWDWHFSVDAGAGRMRRDGPAY